MSEIDNLKIFPKLLASFLFNSLFTLYQAILNFRRSWYQYVQDGCILSTQNIFNEIEVNKIILKNCFCNVILLCIAY